MNELQATRQRKRDQNPAKSQMRRTPKGQVKNEHIARCVKAEPAMVRGALPEEAEVNTQVAKFEEKALQTDIDWSMWNIIMAYFPDNDDGEHVSITIIKAVEDR